MESRVVLFAWTYVPPVLITMGLIGNTIVLITLTSRYSKKSSFTVYLAALAIVDSLFLISFPFTMWMKYVFAIDVETTGSLMCRLYTFVSFLLPFISVWLVVCITVERCFSAYYPHKVKTLCRPKVAYIIVGVLTSIHLVLNSHILYGVEYFSDDNVTTCYFVDTPYSDFMLYYWGWIAVTIYYFLPVPIMIVANCTTVITMKKTAGRAPGQSNTIRKRNRHVLLITLMVSVTFMLLSAPQVILVSLRPFLFENVAFYYPNSIAEQIFEAVSYTGMTLNHSINFLLYFISGRRFRSELKRALSCGWTTVDRNTSSEPSVSSRQNMDNKPSTMSIS